MSEPEIKPIMPTIEEIESDKVQLVLPEKKKRVKKRFTSREQIIDKIDMFTRRKETKEGEIRKLLGEARTYRDAASKTPDNAEIIKSAQRLECKADAVGKRVVFLDLKISHFKEKLAEFDTDTIPGITDDRSVSGL